jgi:hypothetical protein
MVKKPCRICRRWFQPDARVGDRQRVCSREECQAARRKRTQAAWRERNPDYANAWRLQQRCAGGDPDPPRVPPPLTRLPWDLAKDQFGAQGTEILGCFGRLLVRYAKDQMRTQPPGIPGESPRLPPDPPKDEIGGVAA